MTNKLTRTYILSKRLKQVWMLKTIKSNVFHPLSLGRRLRTILIFYQMQLLVIWFAIKLTTRIILFNEYFFPIL